MHVFYYTGIILWELHICLLKKCMYYYAKPISSDCVVPAWKCLVMVANSMLGIIFAWYNVKRPKFPHCTYSHSPLLSHWVHRVPEWTLLSFPALPCSMTLVDLFNMIQTAGTRITQNPSAVEHKHWVVVPYGDPHPLDTWHPPHDFLFVVSVLSVRCSI